MTYLIAISIGPVQDFIAAARRTSDLYAGSQLLQEIVGAAAGHIANNGGELIFPCDATKPAANKILAAVDTEDPRTLCEQASRAAEALVEAKWVRVKAEFSAYLHNDLGDQQVKAFLEFYAAWRSWGGTDESYPEARRQVERLLAARKALRNFKQPCKRNLRKSPLDPSRDTVIAAEGLERVWEDVAGSHRTYIPEPLTKGALWLKDSEWLDAVSLAKRLSGSKSGSAPSTSDVAAATFLSTNSAIRKWFDQSPKIPHGAVFESRRSDLQLEGLLPIGKLGELTRMMEGRTPNPYFAILVADGDDMGARIETITSKSAHQDFSDRLSKFATEATRIVGGQCGHLVYSGGDDVLAFLPVHTAHRCAAALAKEFGRQTKESNTGAAMTLSVGIAIVHHLEPLYVSLKMARDAEHQAKEGVKNSLSLVWHTRGGQSRTARHSWKDGYDFPEWEPWIEAFRAGFTRGFAYELDRLARETKDVALPDEVLQKEATRIFDRKESKGKPSATVWAKASETITTSTDPYTKVTTRASEAIQRLSERLIVLQTIGKYSQDGGR